MDKKISQDLFKKYIDLIIIIIGLLIFASNIGRFFHWQRLKKQEAELRAQVYQDRQEENRLSQLLEYSSTKEFIRSELRRKLGLGQENEVIISLPDLPHIETADTSQNEEKVPNPLAWYRLFFN